MKRLSRRDTLYGIGAAATTTLLAGCVEEGDPGTGNGDDNGDADDGDEFETTVHQVGEALSGPAWRHDDRVGMCLLIADPNDAGWLFAEADDETEAFVRDTNLEESVIAYVESVGPTTCDSLIEFADLGVEDGTLVGDATVASTADDDADVACGEAVTYSGAMVRVTTESLPDRLRVTVTDGWDETAELTGEEGVRDADSLDGFVRPDGDPATVPAALDCPDDEFERHYSSAGDDVNWGSGGSVGGDNGLEIRLVNPAYDGDDPDEALQIERGDEFRVEMTNVSSHDIGVGNHGKYNLEVYTEEGWTDVRGGEDASRFAYTDELVSTRPGQTVEWSFTMTEAGLIDGGPHEDHLRVCPDLEPGRYRFVFWGADDLAVAFDHVG